MEKKNTVWIIEDIWDDKYGPAVHIRVCPTEEVASRTFAEIVAKEIRFWRNTLVLPITDEMLKESGRYDYDCDTNKFTPCDESSYFEDLEITIEPCLFKLYNSMEDRSVEVNMYEQAFVE